MYYINLRYIFIEEKINPPPFILWLYYPININILLNVKKLL